MMCHYFSAAAYSPFPTFEKLSPLPSKETIKLQLETRALENAAARRMRELRREAVTEIRP